MTTAPMNPMVAEFRDIRTDELTDAILSVFDCQGLAYRSAIYLSTPITSGEAILNWHQRVRAGAEQKSVARHLELVRENIAQAGPLIEAARSRFGRHRVVEPTSLRDVPGFTQPDYHRLWCAFIERYAAVVVFNESWELSTGCAVEFATAVVTGKSLLSSDFSELPVPEGLRRLKLAITRLESAGRPVDTHRRVVRVVANHIGVDK